MLAACALVATTFASSQIRAEEAGQDFRFEFKPDFAACEGDGSLKKALSDGIVLGISPSPPYTSIDPANGKAGGIDVEIVESALQWLGVTKISYEVAPFSSLTPALLSKRIDMIAANIHVTPDRLEVISFTGPGWWYGPAITVLAGNPSSIQSFEDLKSHKVGAIAGSAADEYLRSMGVEVVPFQTDADQFMSLSQGRVDVILEDDVKVATFINENQGAGIEMVAGVAIPDDLIFTYGYGYARYGMRKDDCSLRTAISHALAEVRGNGKVSAVLRQNGLSDRNLFYFPVSN
ncbi:ABC-type amino acid transport substrate-binding protein [Mycoplana sp. BE70]|uniref:transporter substrate-binding domain-containing protein n=1 Tax=Mycoplana sp. BE70 TaxID=2817775 RepID=UPI0028589FB8|nr:transporter substrate-binding domain-containing protein [Mycoplana sp. BE70]MDR6757102.1 ABC-type amino acid transport substrate-binding protein [Mycoplana sp. BE70]